jgi:2-dehydro-3-deoxygalactonokinase
MNADATQSAVLIALDWGTSSLRAYRMDAKGVVLDTRHLPWGIMRLPSPSTDGPMPPSAAAGFEAAFEQACGDWLRADPGLPVIACGMVGSAQGWAQAPYLELPADPRDIGAQLATVDTHRGATLHIIPGLLQRQGLANVMRGEETQVVGIMDSKAVESAAGDSEAVEGDADAADDLLVGLPGTHCKWVRVRGGRIVEFDTFMTGEVYAALRGHTWAARWKTPRRRMTPPSGVAWKLQARRWAGAACCRRSSARARWG